MISKDCIHCGRCTRNCKFLEKYNLDLADFERREDLAFNCFLCGKCKLVCPKDIDGREIALKMRRKHVRSNNGRLKGYKGIVWEKKNYLFKNYKKSTTKTALFTGCNFLSYLPNTADKLIDILKERDIGVIFDCCGKPISELGLEKEENKLLERLNKNLEKSGVEELIMVCPNCYYFLKDKIDVKMVNLFTKLKELEIGKDIEKEELNFFRPCPDRETEELLDGIRDYFPDKKINHLDEQCCGAGGCAGFKEKDLGKEMRQDMRIQANSEKFYTYCSTCTGFFKKEGIEVDHILSEILEVEEDCSTNSLLNRMKYKIKR